MGPGKFRLLNILAVSLLVFLFIVPELPIAEAREPIDVTLCELVANPAKYDGKIIRVRGRILIDSREFELDTSSCETKGCSVWLEYGRGPERQPVEWCCRSTRSKENLSVVQDLAFQQFDGYLTATIPDADGNRCHRYDVTATLAGRFDDAETSKRKEAARGFGHLGLADLRIVIQSVSDIVAKDVSDRCK